MFCVSDPLQFPLPGTWEEQTMVKSSIFTCLPSPLPGRSMLSSSETGSMPRCEKANWQHGWCELIRNYAHGRKSKKLKGSCWV